MDPSYRITPPVPNGYDFWDIVDQKTGDTVVTIRADLPGAKNITNSVARKLERAAHQPQKEQTT